MGQETEFNRKHKRFALPAKGREGVVWCYLPIGEQLISGYSSGFRDYFGLPEGLGAPISFANPDLIRGLEKQGLSIECLSSEGPLAGKRADRDRPSELTISSEVVFDVSGLPAGRVLIFERTRIMNLPDQTLQRLQDAQQKLRALSAREAEILDLVYNGMTNKAIGIQSRISEKTVEKHRSNIMHKLGLCNSSHLIRCVSDARLAMELEVNEN